MENPKISVLMCAYNAEKYIEEAIESILNQTFKDFEFIIVDDCSADSTLQIISKYAAKDERIRVISNPENLFISESTNIAIRNSRSNILAKMDADDVSYPERLERQYKFIKNNPQVAILGTNMQIISENGEEICIRKYFPDDESLRKRIFRYCPIAQPTVMYRKDVVEEFGRYYPVRTPAEDLNLWLRMGTKYKFANIPEVLLKYRFFPDSSSNKKLRYVEIKTLGIRWHAWRYQGYKASFLDIFYNIGQALTIFLMPVKLRIKLFNFIRNNFY